MPASHSSRLTVAGDYKSRMASQIAQDIAKREIKHRIDSKMLNERDYGAINREYQDLYRQEYYKYYATLLQQDQPLERIIYIATENPAAKKFYTRHAVASFSKSNLLVYVHPNYNPNPNATRTIQVIRFNVELDEDLETKEAFLGAWPGPLDRLDKDIKRNATNYIDTLQQHDGQRKITYGDSGDDQRKIILKLLTELLHRNGSLDASGITRLLLKPELTEIQKDEGNTKPSETLQKYLLLGKRSEAIKYAKTRKLWDHAQCLAFLDKYQPPNSNNYIRNGLKLKDDPIVQLNNEYISSIDAEILQTVYKSLLNRILQSDPESMNVVKYPVIKTDDVYRFAILSANDCEMEFDQPNEIFKLVNAIKKASDFSIISSNHLISLGFTSLYCDKDPTDDISYRSNVSYCKNDTFASRTLTISNIDMLILNEIWEYCLNLARGTTSPDTYNYIINLVPYKLVFAAKLFDLGLYKMFCCYLSSIKNALSRSYPERDEFYDWDTINKSVEHLTHVWNIFSRSPDTMERDMHNLESTNIPPPVVDPMSLPPPTFSTFHPHASGSENYHSSQDYASLPYQNDNMFSPTQNLSNIQGYMSHSSPLNYSQPPPPIPEEAVNEFNPYPSGNDQSSVHSDHLDSSPQASPTRQEPVSTFSPIQDPPQTMRNNYKNYNAPSTFSRPPPPSIPEESASDLNPQPNPSNNRPNNANNTNNDQASLFANLAGSVRSLLPKSKQMNLPDDSNKKIVYDEQRGIWVNTSKPEGEEDVDYNEPPPQFAPVEPPPTYSLVSKSTKNRYPKAQF